MEYLFLMSAFFDKEFESIWKPNLEYLEAIFRGKKKSYQFSSKCKVALSVLSWSFPLSVSESHYIQLELCLFLKFEKVMDYSLTDNGKFSSR